MNQLPHMRLQRGATLIVGLIMLVLITLMVTAAFMLSTTNLKAVGNMQYRDEAIAAANAAIEQVISSDAIFITPAAQDITVGDYTAKVAAPVCLYAMKVDVSSSADPNAQVHLQMGDKVVTGGVNGFLDTYWDVSATVNDAMSGAHVVTRQGVKITLPADPDPCT